LPGVIGGWGDPKPEKPIIIEDSGGSVGGSEVTTGFVGSLLVHESDKSNMAIRPNPREVNRK